MRLQNIKNFFILQTKIDRVQGADINALESKIQEHIGSGGDDTGEDYGQGLVSQMYKCKQSIRPLYVLLVTSVVKKKPAWVILPLHFTIT